MEVFLHEVTLENGDARYLVTRLGISAEVAADFYSHLCDVEHDLRDLKMTISLGRFRWDAPLSRDGNHARHLAFSDIHVAFLAFRPARSVVAGKCHLHTTVSDLSMAPVCGRCGYPFRVIVCLLWVSFQVSVFWAADISFGISFSEELLCSLVQSDATVADLP